MSRTEITLTEYMDPANGWSHHRSVLSRESALWYIERMAESWAEYAIVNRGAYFTIAHREIDRIEEVTP